LERTEIYQYIATTMGRQQLKRKAVQLNLIVTLTTGGISKRRSLHGRISIPGRQTALHLEAIAPALGPVHCCLLA